MELSFQTSPMEFLRCVTQDVRTQEETAETIVPDSFPDIASIADCSAVPILRGKDCRNGGVTVSGGVKGTILYTPEDRTFPRRLEVYIPFSMKFEHPELTENAQILCSIRVCDLDARAVNSRKAMLRVELSCEILAYEQTEEKLYTMQQGQSEIQTRTAGYQVRLPLEIAEKSFVISDDLDLSNGHPPVAQIYKASCVPELTDQKLVGNKAVFKGILHCKLLCLSENQELFLEQVQLPFSQYCELERDYDQEEASVYPVVTGYDLELEGGESAQRVLLTANILAQTVVSGTQSITLVEDAYSTKGNFVPQWKEYTMDSCLDQQASTQTVRQHLPGEIREVLDCDVYWNYPVFARRDQQMEVSVPAKIRVLGYDESGDLHTLRASAEATQSFALSCNAQCRTTTAPVGEILTAKTADGVEARCALSMVTSCYSGQKLRTLCGGTVEEEIGDKSRPSVILRKVPGETSLWELAKLYGSTEEAIRRANHLDAERLAEDALLLLPIG